MAESMTAEPVAREVPAPAVEGKLTKKAKHRMLGALAVGAMVAMGAFVGSQLVPQPGPDASLVLTGLDPDDQLIALLQSEGRGEDWHPAALRGASEMEIDLSTLRAYGTYRGIEVWSAVNVFESPCLIAAHRPTVDIVARSCVPAGAELFIDTDQHGLAPGETLRFVLRGDAVDAYLLVPEGRG